MNTYTIRVGISERTSQPKEKRKRWEEDGSEDVCMHRALSFMSLPLCIFPVPEQRYVGRRGSGDVPECSCGIGLQRLCRTHV